MKKVLRIINRFNLGGPTFNAAYLTKYLYPDYETLLIGGIKEEHEESSEYIVKNLDVNYRIIPEMHRSINPFNDIKVYNAIRKIIKDYKPDIVHTHAAKAGAVGRYAAWNENVPVILHTFHGHVFHSYFNKYKTGIFKYIERNLAHKSTNIIAISDIQKHELSAIHNICPPDKIVVIPLGFDLSRFRVNTQERNQSFRKTYNIKDDEIVIGIIGRLAPVKNHKLFIDSIRYLMEHSSKKFRAVIIGDGELLEELKQQITNYNLSYAYLPFESKKKDDIFLNNDAQIIFTSWVKQLEYVLPAIDIVALTSLNEGTPVSLIEAQASDKPIVSTKVGGIGNVVKEGVTALLSEINDEHSFHSNLLSIVENAELREKLSGGWSFVENKFHYTRLVNDMKNLYDSLVK